MGYLLSKAIHPLQEMGIKVEVMLCDIRGVPIQTLIPEYDGLILSVNNSTPLEFCMFIRIPRDQAGTSQKIRVVSVHGKGKEVTQKKKDLLAGSLYSVFTKKIRNRETTSDAWKSSALMTTKHEGNNIRLVVVENENFQMWEVAIVTRATENDKANLFLTVQMLYQATMYNLNGEIFMPIDQYEGYIRWQGEKGLKEFLEKSGIVDMDCLLKVCEQFPRSPNGQTGSPDDMLQIVDWFCLASGQGFSENGHFIHWKEIRGQERFACVKNGEIVMADPQRNENGQIRLTNIIPLSPAR